MVYRVYVEKKAALANEARALLEDLRAFLGIESLTGLRLFNRYDLEGISRELFDYTVKTVLSEPQLDIVTDALPQGDAVFAVEYLPGQYDQRADSAAQCVQILSQGERPLVRTARVYALEGKLTDDEIAAIKQYVINPVERHLWSCRRRCAWIMTSPPPCAPWRASPRWTALRSIRCVMNSVSLWIWTI